MYNIINKLKVFDEKNLNIIIKKINILFIIKDISSIIYNTEKSILFSIYIKELLNKKLKIILIKQKV